MKRHIPLASITLEVFVVICCAVDLLLVRARGAVGYGWMRRGTTQAYSGQIVQNALAGGKRRRAIGRSFNRHDCGEGPGPVKDLFTRFIHPDGIVPAFNNRKIVDLGFVAAKMNDDGTIHVEFGAYIVVAVDAQIVLRNEAVGNERLFRRDRLCPALA